jgi:hypothetical protein
VLNGQQGLRLAPYLSFFLAIVLSKYYFIVFSCIRVNIPLEIFFLKCEFSVNNHKTRPKKDCTK